MHQLSDAAYSHLGLACGKELYEAYGNKGLVVLGIHSSFQKDRMGIPGPRYLQESQWRGSQDIGHEPIKDDEVVTRSG